MLLIIPVIALYFTEYWLTLTQITLLQSIFSIAYFLLEIPTWYIADRYGRKTSIIVWTIIIVLSYMLYWAWSNFRSFAIAEIIMAVGLTCISWSDSALLYDTLKKAGKEKAAKKREWRLHFAWDIAGVLSWAVAWFIWFYYWFNVLRLISAIIVWITIPIAFSLEEINQKKETNKVFNTRKDFSEIVTTLKTQPRILWLILYTWIIWYATYSLVRSQQQWLEELGAPIAWFWVIWWILRMSVAWAWLWAHKYDERLW
jgi:MFS family permease